MNIRLALALMLWAAPALAQVDTAEPRIGAPYVDTSVTLRDFTSLQINSLRNEVLRLLEERDRQYTLQFSAAKEAVAIALAAIDNRLASVNEFRATLADQQATFPNKGEVEAKLAGLAAGTAANTKRLDDMAARSEGAGNLWGYIIGGVGLLMGLGSLLIVFIPRSRAAR